MIKGQFLIEANEDGTIQMSIESDSIRHQWTFTRETFENLIGEGQKVLNDKRSVDEGEKSFVPCRKCENEVACKYYDRCYIEAMKEK